MKYAAAVLSACVFMLMNTNLAMPDELSDLKKQFEVLQQKIETGKEAARPGQIGLKKSRNSRQLTKLSQSS